MRNLILFICILFLSSCNEFRCAFNDLNSMSEREFEYCKVLASSDEDNVNIYRY